MKVGTFHCSLCGHHFEGAGNECRKGCPFGKGCNLICCPRCGYQFVTESRVVHLLKKIWGARRKGEG